MTTTLYKSVEDLQKDAKYRQSRSEVLFQIPALRWDSYRIHGLNRRPKNRKAYAQSKIYLVSTSNNIASVTNAIASITLNVERRSGNVFVNDERFLLAVDAPHNTWGLYPAISRDGTWVCNPFEEDIASFKLSRSIDWKIFIRMDGTWLVLIQLGPSNFRLYAMENPPQDTKVAEYLGGIQIRGQLTLLAIMENELLSLSSAYYNLLDGESPNIIAAVTCVARNIILFDEHFK